MESVLKELDHQKTDIDDIHKMLISEFIDEWLDGVKIKSRSKLVTKKQFKGIIGLLHPDYRRLGTKVVVFGSKLSAYMRCLNPFLSYSFSTYELAGNGEFSTHDNYISIFEFKYRQIDVCTDMKKLYMVDAFLHELRHAWQMHHKPTKFNRDVNNYKDCNQLGYQNQWIERDARQFSVRMMNRHKDKINEVLGIEIDWNYQ